jgi:HSP20 family protein
MKDTAEKTGKETSESTQVNQGQGGGSGSGQSSQSQTARGQGGQSKQMSPTSGGRGQSQRSLTRREGFMPSLWMENPFGMMRRFSEEVDRIFDEFGMGRGIFGSRFGRVQESGQAMWSPQIEMHERDNQLVVCVDLPGLKKDDVNLEITDDALVIRGERHQEFEDTQQGYRRSERSYGSFYRAIPLPEGVDAEQAKANFQDGVLRITLPLPKQQQSRGRRIEVQEGGSSSPSPTSRQSESSSQQRA